MPIYDYVCSNGHVTEVIHGVHDAGPNACPVCGEPLRKAMSAPSIVFKGSGWAKKDRSATSSPSATKSGTADKTAPAKSSDGGTDAGASSTDTSKPSNSTSAEAS